MIRRIQWSLFILLLLSLEGMAGYEYLSWRVSNPLRFHMDRPPSKYVPGETVVEVRVENASNFPVVYLNSSMHSQGWPDMNPAWYYFDTGSRGNGVVIKPSGVYVHREEFANGLLGLVGESRMRIRYQWAPRGEAWYAKTCLPMMKRHLPKSWARELPDIRWRREYQPLQVPAHEEREPS